ncbi:MAG TPA: 3,4-dihydroxy-2-butanone-4-phosphate synthase [Fibrobacteria bacterium]|nr:3,4-dihydroxy-2-butanone-4-phosphate synthase [Fibrobacteria bacterium]
MKFDTIDAALADLKKGRAIVVVDDKNRENEGDVVFAASRSTPAKINFLARHARGLICVALSADRVDALGLRPMADRNGSRHETAFTISVEAREGTTTGISAADRSLTARALANESLDASAFVSPGHTFPIRARRGGVLVRAGHTEAAVDLVEMAGLGCAGVICEIMNENGTMARLPDCARFARKHGLKIISVADLIHYRHTREKQVRRAGSFTLPTAHGTFVAHAFEDLVHGRMHLALVRGAISPARAVNVRVHSEFLLGDVFGAARSLNGEPAEEVGTLQQGLRLIARDGGVFLYMRPIQSEEVLARVLDAYILRDAGLTGAAHTETVDTTPAGPAAARDVRPGDSNAPMDARTYGIGAQILFELGVRRLNLLTNHPQRVRGLKGLEGYGLHVVRRTPLAGGTGREAGGKTRATGTKVKAAAKKKTGTKKQTRTKENA